MDIADTGSNAVLVENCHNVTLAAQSGTVSDSGEIRIAARAEFANTSDVAIRNLTVTNTAIRGSPCGDNVTFSDITRVNSSLDACGPTPSRGGRPPPSAGG